MKAAVFSDTHGNTALMVEAVRRMRPDIIIHLGDYSRDTDILTREFPEIPLYSVRGNCDFGTIAPDTDIVPFGEVKAFISHGHIQNVKWGIERLVYAAMEAGCKLALCGHTHEPMNEEVAGVKVVNPGSAGTGRTPTFAVIEVFPNGGIASEIRVL